LNISRLKPISEHNNTQHSPITEKPEHKATIKNRVEKILHCFLKRENKVVPFDDSSDLIRTVSSSQKTKPIFKEIHSIRKIHVSPINEHKLSIDTSISTNQDVETSSTQNSKTSSTRSRDYLTDSARKVQNFFEKNSPGKKSREQIMETSIKALQFATESAQLAGGTACANLLEVPETIRKKQFLKLGGLTLEGSGDALIFVNAFVLPMAELLTTGVASLGAGCAVLTAHNAYSAKAQFAFHAQCVKHIKGHGIIKFIKKHLDLTEEEKNSPKSEKILNDKHKLFEQRTNKDILDRSKNILEDQSFISKEMLSKLAQDIETTSFENGIKKSLNTGISGLNTVGAALAIPSHGISLILTSGITLVYFLANRNDTIVKSVASRCWKQTEMGQDSEQILMAMPVICGKNGEMILDEEGLKQLQELQENSVFQFMKGSFLSTI